MEVMLKQLTDSLKDDFKKIVEEELK